jgi:hypothetical protein
MTASAPRSGTLEKYALAQAAAVLIAKGALTVAGDAAYQSVSESRQGKCNLRCFRQGVS